MQATETLVCKECAREFTCTSKYRTYAGHWCQDCRRAYTRAAVVKSRSKPVGKAKAAAWIAANGEKLRGYSAKRRAANRAWLDSLKDTPCCDCGIKYHPFVMEFDHVGGNKLACVGHLKNCSRDRVLAEIAKCQLVCANCHRMRTLSRREEKKKNDGFKVPPARCTA